MTDKNRTRALAPRRFVALGFTILAAFAAAPPLASDRDAGQWQTINTGFDEARHEGASAQAGKAFYVIGGRESSAVRIYDPGSGDGGSWTSGAASPIPLHHFQAVELDGLIYAVGAMTGPFPEEDPVDKVYIYDPLADRWITGPSIPADRLRGSSGAIVHEGLIYWISGNTNGHVGPVSEQVDVYDPATGHFTALAGIPNPRDHFFATLYQGSIYVIGGRQSIIDQGPFEPTVAEVDVYDIAADAWQTLPAGANLNPPRAAAATDRVGNEIIIAGGESDAQQPWAHVEAQAFNPATGQWRDLADMLTPRHATQAIVSNDGFYLAAGSPYRGDPGGAVLDTEALFLGDVTVPTGLPITAGSILAPATAIFDAATGVVLISHQGGNQAVIIKSIQISGSETFSLVEPLDGAVSLAPGAERAVTVQYGGDFEGESAALTLTDSNDQVTTVALEAASEGGEPPPIAFLSQTLTSRILPTQLEFGPDGRLYVAELDGLIFAFTIERSEQTGSYSIAASEVIDLIQTLPNHNDDGTPFASSLRSVTGMITSGTADNPVLFVTSSDPRFDDPMADTNSGILSRLSWTGSEWVKLDLVRSLPRSEHDHLPNGLALDAASGMLYLAQGGHTNMGAPSFSFGYLPEYALSAAILSIDLNAIGEQTYDIPTLQGDVFGGQGGNNQAMIVADGPVQVHSPGYRNPYDVLLTAAGRLYTFDNDSNTGWGGLPVGEGAGGTCTNQSSETGSATHFDNFHLISGPGYYGGHPNPTRANRDNTFAGLSPLPEGSENPIECQFLVPGLEDGALALNNASTNGLAEYTASNFDGQMTGNVIATAYDGQVLRLGLNSAGTQVIDQSTLFTGLSGPLGITAQGDEGPFPGTIWIGQFFNGDITVFEPQDFFVCDPDTLDPGATSPNGYTYGDLIDNGLDPCNPGQLPPDFDQDFVSDLNDPDIDGDGVANDVDRFDFDASNGRGNSLPHRVAWTSDVIGTLGGMIAYNAPGFTGLMAHPSSPVSVFEQFDPNRLIPGGAAGIFTVEAVTAGDAQFNNQENAFHFGIDVDGGSPVFTAQTRILAPFAGEAPQGEQSMGLAIGRGDQDNYIKLVTNANAGNSGIQLAAEIDGAFSSQQDGTAILGADYVDLYLVIDPATASVAASYRVTMGGIPGTRTAAGEAIALPTNWLDDATNGLAVGIIATSRGADAFSASWAFIDVYEGSGDDFPVPGEGQLDANPPSLAFPGTPIGDTSALLLTLSNSGEAALEVNGAILSGDQVFLAELDLPLILEPGSSESVSVRFAPGTAGDFEALLSLAHSAATEPLQIPVTGQGIQPILILVPDPDQLDFGGIAVGSTSEPQAVSLTNAGEAPVFIDSLTLGGEAAGDFSLDADSDSCSGVTLEAGELCSVEIRFDPTQTRVRQATIDVLSDADDVAVALAGQGLLALGLEIRAEPDPAIAGRSLTYTLVVTNLVSVQADDASITVSLPPAAGDVSSLGCQEDPAGHPICTIGTIPASGSIEVELSVQIPGSASGSLPFEAQVSADQLAEPVTGQITTAVSRVADLALLMSGEMVSGDQPNSRVVYWVVVSNAGPSDAVSARVTTELASGLSNLEWTCQAEPTASCSESGDGAFDELADLPAGTSVTYRLEASVPGELLDTGFTSSAEVAPPSDTTDPDLDNNRDSVTIGDRIFQDRFETPAN